MNITYLDLKQGKDIQLLIVDDEPVIRTMLVRAFNLIGYIAEEAASGEEALTLLKTREYDVMVLDLCLPDIFGLDVLCKARELQPEVLVIILTGNASLQSAIAAMRSDAVDYLVKPVRFCEVAYSVTNALKKREALTGKVVNAVDKALGELCRDSEAPFPAMTSTKKIPSRPVIAVPPMQLDRNNKSVMFMNDSGHAAIELSEGETAVLSSLMATPDQPLTCDQLVYSSWGYHMDDYTAGNVIRPYIARLRKKLEPDPKNPQLICTVRGRGYRFSSTK